MNGAPQSPLIWAGLLGTPLLIAVGQLLFKLTSAQVGEPGVRSLLGLFLNPTLIVALVIYGLGTIIWIFVLRSVPLTLAYSFMALTFCFVPVLASLFLGEILTARTLIGAALLVAGTIVINS
ncbi:transporter [Rhizobium sp. SG2393]|uniref:EamA family transporter n=1 Tax=Rhizobium sp. SG2393 TaxID=3276279 RepID=UPI00366B0693